MISLNDRIQRTYKIFTGVKDVLQKQNIDIDGIIGIFNDGIEEGTLLKIYDTFNPEIDICIWVYLPKNREVNNQMKVLTGHHCDCNTNNLWNVDVKEKTFTFSKARDLHDEVRKYIVEFIISNCDRRIELRKDDNNE